MFLHQRTTPGLAIFSYLVGDEKSKICTVIDPVRDVEPYVNIAREQGFKITSIVETHVHADFVSGSLELKTRLGGEPLIYCSGMGGTDWIPTYADHVVQEGDAIEMGSLKLIPVHTPGHTPEHLLWALEEAERPIKLFTGDFLFIGSVGRPDLLGGGELQKLAYQLYRSVFETLEKYPDMVEVLPAHGAGSLCGKGLSASSSSFLGLERKHNPFLVKKPEDVWIKELMKGMPPVPTYFPRMKRVNVTGPAVIGEIRPGLKGLSAEEVQAEREKGAYCLDVRSKEQFAGAHIPGSINIPFSPQLSSWAGWVVPPDVPLILVIDDHSRLLSVIDSLLRVGFDLIAGYLEGGIANWKRKTYGTSSLPSRTAEELRQSILKGTPPYILDVRTEAEWDNGHIEGAHFMHGGFVPYEYDRLPRERPIAVICGSGSRSSTAASVLLREGFEVSNVLGGMTAWQDHKFPVVK